MEININTNNEDDEHTDLKMELRAIAKYLTEEVITENMSEAVEAGRADDIRESFEQIMKGFHGLENGLTGETKSFEPEDNDDEVSRNYIGENISSNDAMDMVKERGSAHIHIQRSLLEMLRESLNEHDIEDIEQGYCIELAAENAETGEEVSLIEFVVEDDDPEMPVIYQHDNS